MKRDVQTSELVFLGLLILIAAYLFLVQIPIHNQMNELKEREAYLQDQITVLQTKTASRNTMKAAVDKAFADANGKPRAIPEYNNISVVTQELNQIFSSSVNYNITFGADKVDKTVVRRNIQISFTENSYNAVVDKLNKITKSNNLYLINTLNINPSKDGQYSVSMALTNFEYVPAK